MNAQFYSPMGLRGEYLVTLIFFRIHAKDRVFRYDKQLLTLVFIFCLTAALFPKPSADAQPLLKESFNHPPDSVTWTGTLDQFVVENHGSQHVLRLNADPDAKIAYIGTKHTYHPVLWEWNLRQDFVSSDNNRSFFFLKANDPALDLFPAGLAIQAGESGQFKHFKLKQLNPGDTPKTLIDSNISVEAGLLYRFRVIACQADSLHLFIASHPNEPPLLQASASIPKSFSGEPGHTGFRAHFTSTRNRHFYLGGLLLKDTIPDPELTGIRYHQIDESPDNKQHQLTLIFSLPVISSNLDVTLLKDNKPIALGALDCSHAQVCTIHLDDPLPSSIYNLRHGAICSTFDTCTTKGDHPLVISVPPESGDLIINELLYQPDHTGNGRFVELLNISDKVLDIQSLRLSRSTGSPAALSSSSTNSPVYLKPGEKAVVSGSDLATPDNGLHLIMPSFPSFSRFGDTITLINSDDVIIDKVTYRPGFGGNRDGVSIERIDPNSASHDPANWKEHPIAHTAGSRNYHYNNSPSTPRPIFAGLEDSRTIRVLFDRFVDPSSLSTAYLDDDPLTRVHPHSMTPRSTFLFNSPRDIDRSFREVLLDRVSDVAGRISSEYRIPLSFQPSHHDILINEIMYQPVSDRYGLKPDQSEYIEFVNATSIPLQLPGIHVHDRPDKNGRVQRLDPITPESAVLMPGDYAVIYADTANSFSDSRLFQVFSLEQDSEDRFLRVDRMTLGLSVSGDDIFLAGNDGIVLDHVRYDPSWHNPNVIDTRGISLERLCVTVDSQSPDNWTSNSCLCGGTPGTQNTVSLPDVSDGSVNDKAVKLTPNPFSPSMEHLRIYYQSDMMDGLLRIRIFDRNGRLVRTLADGERAERAGSRLWDGRMDNGILCRQGIYIVLIELFHPHEGKSQTHRSVAVVAR